MCPHNGKKWHFVPRGCHPTKAAVRSGSGYPGSRGSEAGRPGSAPTGLPLSSRAASAVPAERMNTWAFTPHRGLNELDPRGLLQHLLPFSNSSSAGNYYLARPLLSPFAIMFNPTDTCLGLGGPPIKRDEKTSFSFPPFVSKSIK